ncbi:WRKY transcription factor 1-like [Zingiber officinale]|uniref:WRKY domain-containing protein n=1 Tax=Zingiber officinale TaxID=94328 RepID=A0A8J5GPM6_ZINOF|nr:WRKY transcription factor 1-like [Zingiber officinale]KAG6507693.1 hypothetical protein ZIOFF_033044 [Zingiber officinale]
MENTGMIMSSVIREVEHAATLTRKLQSYVEMGDYSDWLKGSVRTLSEEVMENCKSTLSKLMPAEGSTKRKRSFPCATDRLQPRDLRRSFARKEVTNAPYYDAHRWRKYGEKFIKGSVFKKNYYRCTYSLDRRCQAKKQVQQQGASLFLVVYEGEHTCNSTSGTTNERSLSSAGRTFNFQAESEPENEPPLIHLGEMDSTVGDQNAINGGRRCESPQGSLVMLELGDPTIFDSFSEPIANHFANDDIVLDRDVSATSMVEYILDEYITM